MKLVYIAGPYRRTDTSSQERNIRNAERVAVAVVNCAAKYGWFPVTPHLNTAHFDRMIPAMSPDYWLDGTAALLLKCDAVLLTSHDAAEVSKGTAAEIDLARRNNIPVYETFDAFVKATQGDESNTGYFKSCRATDK